MTTGYSSGGGKYYTDKEVADLLGVTLGRLRNKLSAGGVHSCVVTRRRGDPSRRFLRQFISADKHHSATNDLLGVNVFSRVRLNADYQFLTHCPQGGFQSREFGSVMRIK